MYGNLIGMHPHLHTLTPTHIINVRRHNELPPVRQTRRSSALALATMTHPPAGYSDCLSFKMLREAKPLLWSSWNPLRTHFTQVQTHTLQENPALHSHTRIHTYCKHTGMQGHTHAQIHSFPFLTENPAWFVLVVACSTQPVVCRNNSYSIPNGCC